MPRNKVSGEKRSSVVPCLLKDLAVMGKCDFWEKGDDNIF